jgi:hypothetical protein
LTVRSSPDVRAAGFLVLLIVVVYADILFLGRGLYAAGVADLLGYHIPMNWVLRDIVSRGAFPYWNPFFSAGQPLAANPAYEVFYPLQWLILLPSFHFGFQFHIVIHFVIAALGMYLLLRGLRATPMAATFGAAVFVFCGPYLSVATKLPMLFSLSWMPLALECVRREIDAHRRRRFAIAALVLSLQLIIAEPTIIIQTWMFIAGYVIWLRKWRAGFTTVAALALAAALVAAVQLIPAMDFARDSVRSQAFSFQDVADWSMPGSRVIEFGLPSVFRPAAITTMYRGRTEAYVMEIYLGVFVLLLALAGILTNARGTRLVLIAAGASIVLAMGEHTPLLKLFYGLHLRSIRYPEKFIISGAFALIVFAALLFDRLLERDRRLIRTMLTLAGIWLGVMLIAFAASADHPYFGQQVLRAIVALAFVLLLRNSRLPVAAAIIAASVLDLWLATGYLVPRMPHEFFDVPPIARTIPPHTRIYPDAFWQFLDSDPNVLGWIRNVPDKTYWWMLRNSMVDHLPARFGFGIVMEGDTDRTSLRTTDDFREAMRGLSLRHVMAADEPFLKMSGAGAKLTYRPADAPATDATTPVDAIVRDYPRFAFADKIVRTATLEEMVANLEQQRGLGYVAYADIEPFAPAHGEVLRADETPNAISLDVRAAGPALLAIAITAHRYWSATVDGAAAPLVPVNFTYQGVRVPAGSHRIEMRYRNPWILPSGVISILAIIVLGAGMTRRASEPA